MTIRQELISQVYIKLDGQDAPTRLMNNLVSVEVDDSLNLPDMFTINIRDPGWNLQTPVRLPSELRWKLRYPVIISALR